MAALLRRVRRDNGLKEPFWPLVLDGLPTVARLRTTCKCGAAAPGNRLHHYWSCPVAAAVTGAIAAAAGSAVPRRMHAGWLCRAPPLMHASVWHLVCLAAIGAGSGGLASLGPHGAMDTCDSQQQLQATQSCKCGSFLDSSGKTDWHSGKHCAAVHQLQPGCAAASLSAHSDACIP